jgi:hypothetical protein
MVEVTMTITIFCVLAYTMASAVGLSNSSRRTVAGIAESNATLRSVVGAIADDLRTSADDRIATVELADGETQLTLQVPVVAGGAVLWGVPGEDVATVGGDDQVGWSLRYAVADAADGSRCLTRDVLDADGAVRRSKVIARGLSAGGAAPPGLAVVRTGDVWEVTVTLADAGGRVETTNVATRN